MNIAIILSGGQGSRLKNSIPKQYIEINGKPILQFSLETFEKCSCVHKLILVVNPIWQDYVKEIIHKAGISKFATFAPAGSSRQHSIFNGLTVACHLATASETHVIIHDAARPFVTQETITACLDGLKDADAVMPVLPVKDTVYISKDGSCIDGLLRREQLVAGQAPESFRLDKYYAIHTGLSEDDFKLVHGSSEIAYKNNLKVRLIAGDEHNYKITTHEDLEKFKQEVTLLS